MDNLERTNARVTGASSGIGQAGRIVAPRRLFLRNSGAAVLSGATVGLLGRAALADAATTPQANPHDSAPTQFRAVGDARLAYRQFGKEGAPPLVCLQHFTGRMDNWDPIHTNRLAQDRPVVLVDYRGVGRSSGETPDSVPGMGRDIIAFIRALGARQVDIFGFSIGGMVAQQIALDAPQLVRRLILAGTGPAGGEGMAAFSPQVQEINRRPNSTAAERMLELLFSPTATSQAAGKAWLARIAARQVDREPPASPQVAAAQLAALKAWGEVTGERYGSLKNIPHRTLVVNGHDDIMVPTVNSFILQQKLPNARLILFPDSGHGAHFQFPEEFAEAAARFLAEAMS
jgi:pimeloyl-ACP methyl ester carboxylesterase